MATYYVDCNMPDDSGNGLSWETAKKYIYSAITAASSGDTIYVKEGQYTNGSDRIYVNKNLTIIGVGKVYQKPSGYNNVSPVTTSSLTVKNFTFIPDTGKNCVNIASASCNFTFEDCVFSEPLEQWLTHLLSITTTSGTTVTFNRCIFRSDRYNVSGGASFAFFRNNNNIVFNYCKFLGNRTTLSKGFYFYSFTGTTTLNNCFISSATDEIQKRCFYVSSDSTGKLYVNNSILCLSSVTDLDYLFYRGGTNFEIHVSNSIMNAKQVTNRTLDTDSDNIYGEIPKVAYNNRIGFVLLRLDDLEGTSFMERLGDIIRQYGAKITWVLPSVRYTQYFDSIKSVILNYYDILDMGCHGYSHTHFTATEAYTISKDGSTITIDRQADKIYIDSDVVVDGFRNKSLSQIKTALEAAGCTVGSYPSSPEVRSECLGEALADTNGPVSLPYAPQFLRTTVDEGLFYVEAKYARQLAEQYVQPLIDGYTCSSFGAPGNTTNGDTEIAVVKAVFDCNCSTYSYHLLLSTHGYQDIYRIITTSCDDFDGESEEVVRAKVRNLASMVHNGVNICILFHNDSQLAAINKFTWFLDELIKCGIPSSCITSLKDFVAYVKENYTHIGDGIYTRQPAEVIDIPTRDSIVCDAGTDVGLSQDFYGNPVPMGSAPDIGCHEFDPNFYYHNSITLTHSKKAIDLGNIMFGKSNVSVPIRKLIWNPTGTSPQVVVKDAYGNVVFSASSGKKEAEFRSLKGLIVEQNALQDGTLQIILRR